MKRLFSATFFLAAMCVSAPAADAPKPNFIVINIDDLGYADIEPFGSKLNPTPNLKLRGRPVNRLAAAPSSAKNVAMLNTISDERLPNPRMVSSQ